MIAIFSDSYNRENSEEFTQWLRSQRCGYVLNQRSLSSATIHAWTCDNLDSRKGSRTADAKIWCANKAELKAWAEKAGIKIDACGGCNEQP